MFVGSFTQAIDEQGRLTLPAVFRDELAAGMVITRALDRSLMVLPLNAWKKLADQIAAQPLSRPAARALRRRLFAAAIDVTADRHGRIALPQVLRDFANLNGEVVVTGLYDFVEIWNTESWRAASEAGDNTTSWEELEL